ncbi:hypothetical protein [Aneurinibacillus danicus]|uniref:Uncharacterized protein n=1 Tax=Aneurinibacillus danicus TaxID=267746 RepID=A0A511V6W5_9BACL|nr:hypothetical protein [Aneurinibacillus danicus]GEN33658.1 hypothetical protein ADA01nite_11180 [Aneurinibacillus danicus]
MIAQMIKKDAWNQIEDQNLRWLFQLTDTIDILYSVVGRPGIPRRVMIRCFLIKRLLWHWKFLHHHVRWSHSGMLLYIAPVS